MEFEGTGAHCSYADGPMFSETLPPSRYGCARSSKSHVAIECKITASRHTVDSNRDPLRGECRDRGNCREFGAVSVARAAGSRGSHDSLPRKVHSLRVTEASILHSNENRLA